MTDVSRLDHLSFNGGDQTSERDSALMPKGELRMRHWDWGSKETPEPKLGAEKTQQQLPKDRSRVENELEQVHEDWQYQQAQEIPNTFWTF